MASTSASRETFFGLLRDFWLMAGVPRRLWDSSGKRWKSLAKAANNGWSGDGEIQFPSRTELPAAGSADFATAWAQSNPAGSDKWVVTDNERWQVMTLNWRILELSVSEQTSYLRARRAEQEAHMQRYMNLMSYFCYGNGGGAVARLKTGFAPSGQTVLELENPRSAKFFENEIRSGVGGDQIQFAPDDGSSPTGIRENVIATVTAVDVKGGKITVKAGLPSDVVEGDYIFYRGDYGRSFRGFTAWTPLTAANLSTPFFGVDRSRRKDRLAGTRIPYKKSEQPYTITRQILQVCHEQDININRMTIPSSEWTKWEQDLHASNVTWRPMRTSESQNKLQVGFTALELLDNRFDEPIMVYPDRYWEPPDINADTAGGGIYLCDRMDDEVWYTYRSGLSWKDYDNTGALKQILGTQNLAAVFGHFGQSVLRNTKNRVVAGPEGTVVE